MTNSLSFVVLLYAIANAGFGCSAALLHASALGLNRSEVDDLDPMPGADFVQHGVDVTRDPWGTLMIDEGKTSRLPVYAPWTYDGGMVWRNPSTKELFKVPDMLSPVTKEEAYEAVVEDIAYEYKYVFSSSFSRFNVGVKITTANVSASVDLNHQAYEAKTKMSNESHVYAGSEMWWKLFDIAIYPPELVGGADPMLLKAFEVLPPKPSSEQDFTKYQSLVKNWGTHFVSSGNFGGRLKHDVYVDTAYYASKSESWVSNQIDLTFHYDVFDLSSGGFTNRSEIDIDQDFAKHSRSYLYREGGIVTTNGSLEDWFPTIQDAPHFLNITLDKISNLCEDADVQRSLDTFIKAYLAHPDDNITSIMAAVTENHSL